MESSDKKVFFVTSITSLSLAALASIPTALSIARRLNGQFRSSSRNALISTTESVVYVDEDGEATKDSVEVFSGKWQRIAAILLSFAGLGASVSQTMLMGEAGNRIPFILRDSIWVGRETLGSPATCKEQRLTLLFFHRPSCPFKLPPYPSNHGPLDAFA